MFDSSFLETEFRWIIEQFVKRGGVETDVVESGVGPKETEFEFEFRISSQPWP